MSKSVPRDPRPECGEKLQTLFEEQPSIARAEIWPHPPRMIVDYDPRQLSDAALGDWVSRVQPEASRHFRRCRLRLLGRACESCAIRLERKVEKIPGVRRATATFVGGAMTVNYDEAVLTEAEVVDRVRATGAPAALAEVPAPAPEGWRAWLQGDRAERLFTAATLLFMLGAWALPRWGAPAGVGTVGYVLAYLAGGWFGVQAGWRSLRQGTVDVDLLMVLAALGAAVVGAPFEGAMLLFLFSLSNVLQAYAMDRTRKAVQALMKLRPSESLCRRDGVARMVPIDQLVVGDVVIVRPGESLPLDGTVVEGESTLDESMLTGESMPVTKGLGQSVFAGTLNQTGALEVRVTRLAKDSTLAKLIRLIEDAQSEKARTQRFLDRAEQAYALGVILFTLGLILVPWLLLGQGFEAAFYRAMTVMVVASPCALIISTPATILSAIGGAARRGVLFKGGAHLERLAEVEVVAFDKTGTLTQGRPRVTDVLVGSERFPFAACSHGDALDLLQVAAAVEMKSEHPLARAIVTAAQERRLAIPEATAFQSTSGKGAVATVRGRRIIVGSPGYLQLQASGAELAVALAQIGALQDEGRTCVLVGEQATPGAATRILGVLAVADGVRPDAAAVVARLRALGVKRVAMLTGDHERVARAVAREVGVDEVHAGLLPEDKVRIVRQLRELGPVAMVGDGVNDAPALAAADLGMAMGAAGTDVAMETADVVLMSDNLQNIALAIDVSRRARRVVLQNLTFALAVILVMVVATLSVRVPMPLGVVAHEGSTVLVCLNGLRLLLAGSGAGAARSRLASEARSR